MLLRADSGNGEERDEFVGRNWMSQFLPGVVAEEQGMIYTYDISSYSNYKI